MPSVVPWLYLLASDIHTVFEGALGERTDMILGHEAVGEVVEIGN